MTLLTLDQSSRITGYAVFVDNKLTHYSKFTLTDDDMGTRLTKYRTKLKELIDQYHPNEVVYEDIQQQNNVQNNVQTFKILAEVYGVTSQLLTELHIPHSSVLAVQWKSTLDIKGKNRTEQKRNAQQYVTKTYAVTPTQDEADAICIGCHYIAKQNDNKCAWAD